jgi:hypothetical protein
VYEAHAKLQGEEVLKVEKRYQKGQQGSLDDARRVQP